MAVDTKDLEDVKWKSIDNLDVKVFGYVPILDNKTGLPLTTHKLYVMHDGEQASFELHEKGYIDARIAMPADVEGK